MRRTTLDVLEKLEDAHRMHTRSLQERNDWDEWAQIRDLQLSQLSSNLKQLKVMGERSTTVLILESLYFQRMEAREEKIIDAHAQTFEWIFDPDVCSSQLPSADNFVEWLANGNGLFWITGKAGSGKSTLMKFLSHHQSTKSALRQWADGKKLITAAFFFWHAGSELQKSQEGLLLSLLHSILSQCPDIMPQVLCRRWEQCARTQSTSSHWTRAELLKAFSELSHRQSSLNKKFCFFIDGLDEYDGNHLEVVGLLQGFATSQDIKICLSSRPWNVFTRAFGWGSHPKFHLEDLTQRDIKLYVQAMLGGNGIFRQLAAGKDSTRCIRLEDEIVSRAQGVFLWVFLVVRSLIEGLTNADRITDLERRLHSLPTDLEAYFRHMLGNIEEVYVQQTVRTFHIALQTVEPLSLMTYAMIDELEENPRYAIELPVQQMTTTDIESRCQDMKLRINARCKDLLQITRKGFQKSDAIPNSVPALHPFFQYEVDFLHRTVKDFFQVNDVQRFITSRIPETFEYCDLLCHALLAQIKVAPIEMHQFTRHGELLDLVDDLTHFAHQAETQTARPNVELLDELSKTIRVQRASLHIRESEGFDIENFVLCPTMKKLCQSSLGFAVQQDLQMYVTHKLDEALQCGSLAWESDGLILDALSSSKRSEHGANWTMLRLLVDRGVRLNWPLLSSGTTDYIIGPMSQKWAYLENDTRVNNLEVINTLLEARARLDSSQPGDLSWVQIILIPPANWRTGSIEFEEALTRTIVAICERGIDPYWEFEGHTLWSYLIRSIQGVPLTPRYLSLETTRSVLIIIKKFMGLGARLSEIVYQDIDKYENGNVVGLQNLSVTDILTPILTKMQLEELELLERRRDWGSWKPKASGVQKRGKKTRRKERRKLLGH